MNSCCADFGAKSDSGDSGLGTAASPDAASAAVAADVCRDFLRHVCKRGRRCRYRHPEPDECARLARSAEPVFCHDYQNGGCQRPACRFAHCSREEEAAFRSTGVLPACLLQDQQQDQQQDQLQDQQDQRARADLAAAADSAASDATAEQQQPPVCKDFLKGACVRGARCRFRHVEPQQPQPPQPPKPPQPSQAQLQPTQPPTTTALSDLTTFQLPKRRRVELTEPLPPGLPTLPTQPQMQPVMTFAASAATPATSVSTTNAAAAAAAAAAAFGFLPAAGGVGGGGCGGAVGASFDWSGRCEVRMLAEENAALRRRLDDLRRQCGDLLAANELLLDQNARLRSGGGPGSVVSCTKFPLAAPSSMDVLTYAHAAMNDFAAAAAVAAAASAASSGGPGAPPPPSLPLPPPPPTSASAAVQAAAAVAAFLAFQPGAKLGGQQIQ